MLTILYIIAFVAATINVFLWGGSIFNYIGVVLLCIFYALQKYVFRDKMPKRISKILGIAAIGIIIMLLLNMGLKGTDNGIMAYSDNAEKAVLYLANGDYEAAAKVIEKLEEQYGESDYTHMLNAVKQLSVGDILQAEDELFSVKDKESKLYYIISEKIYYQDTNSESVEKLYNLYIEAADKYPSWEYMVTRAGITRFEQGNYIAAQYYLYNAYNINDDNPLITYYLGAVSFEMGKPEDAKAWFDESVEDGASDIICSYIVWYVQQMND